MQPHTPAGRTAMPLTAISRWTGLLTLAPLAGPLLKLTLDVAASAGVAASRPARDSSQQRRVGGVARLLLYQLLLRPATLEGRIPCQLLVQLAKLLLRALRASQHGAYGPRISTSLTCCCQRCCRCCCAPIGLVRAAGRGTEPGRCWPAGRESAAGGEHVVAGWLSELLAGDSAEFCKRAS